MGSWCLWMMFLCVAGCHKGCQGLCTLVSKLRPCLSWWRAVAPTGFCSSCRNFSTLTNNYIFIYYLQFSESWLMSALENLLLPALLDNWIIAAVLLPLGLLSALATPKFHQFLCITIANWPLFLTPFVAAAADLCLSLDLFCLPSLFLCRASDICITVISWRCVPCISCASSPCSQSSCIFVKERND